MKEPEEQKVGHPANHYRFTGKERDSETGLDYFRTRFHASTMGRFTSPDPLSITAQKLADPQQWNMYSYARNNPLRFTDPTGQYVCNGNKNQCGKVKNALAEARKALEGYDKKSKEYKALNRVLNFYGKEGQVNGVIAVFGALKGTAAAATGTTTTPIQGPGGMTLSNVVTTTVKFDLSKTANATVEDMAEVAVHEGQHGVNQWAVGHSPTTESEVRTQERNAYRTQSYVPEGLGRSSAWGLWDPAWSADQAEAIRSSAINSNAEKSTQWWVMCQQTGGC